MNQFHKYPPQDVTEFEEFCQLVRELRPTTYIEVGSRHGRSLIRIAEAAMPYLKKIVVIDLPNGRWGTGDSYESLQACCANLRERGIEVELHAIKSQGEEAGQIADAMTGKADLVFIDADHAYESVKKDFHRFFPCVSETGALALHDIKGKTWVKVRGVNMGVPHFWCNLIDSGEYSLREIYNQTMHFGIGIVRRLEAVSENE